MATQANRDEEAGIHNPFRSQAYRPIEDYGMIGDLHTIALVGKDGSIDWCCLPHFDSPSVFASILDTQKGGFFKIAPTYPTIQKQMYVAESNILLSRFLAPEGVGEITDFMPIKEETSEELHIHQIVRQVKVVRVLRVAFRVESIRGSVGEIKNVRGIRRLLASRASVS